MSLVEPDPQIIAHLEKGSQIPCMWPEIASGYAATRSLPQRRLREATRLLGNFYPLNSRRFWLVSNAGVPSTACHAQSMIEFEATFDEARVSADQRTMKLIEGRESRGCWLWESLVEDVEQVRNLGAAGKERLARWASCRILRAYYPYARPAAPWRLDASDARHVVGLIEFEFGFTRQHRIGNELEVERNVAAQLAEQLPESYQRMCREIMNGSPTAYARGLMPSSNGVYAIFREMADRVPTYVGRGTIADRFTRTHEHEWEWARRRRMYVKWFAQGDAAEIEGSKNGESVLLAVFNPPANNMYCVPSAFRKWGFR